MQHLFKELPEIFGPFATNIRVPEYTSVFLTEPMLRLVDSREMQRLRRVRQLGFVRLVYPGAEHSRFEHSVGVYFRACQVAKHLCEAEGLLEFATQAQVRKLLLAALVHDLGHYHGTHVIEELGKIKDVSAKLAGFDHLKFGRRLLTARYSELGAAVEREFGIGRGELADFAFGKKHGGGIEGELYRLLDGPIDVDKMDYLERDSIHTGVPYGRNFDAGRLLQSFIVLRQGDGRAGILLREKGKASAEIFIFSRYVMFTEVYWHHTARCFAAMFRRAFMDLVKLEPAVEDLVGEKIFSTRGCRYYNDLESFLRISELARRGGSRTKIAGEMLANIAAGRAGLYKRLLTLRGEGEPGGRQYEAKLICRRLMEVYHAGLENWLQLGRRVARRVGKKTGIGSLREHHILIDTPLLGDRGTTYPLYFPREDLVRDITEVSPVAGALDKMFNEAAQQVRVYCRPDFAGRLSSAQVYDALVEILD
jgi:HD superfamily phosphohydrolase